MTRIYDDDPRVGAQSEAVRDLGFGRIVASGNEAANKSCYWFWYKMDGRVAQSGSAAEPQSGTPAPIATAVPEPSCSTITTSSSA